MMTVGNHRQFLTRAIGRIVATVAHAIVLMAISTATAETVAPSDHWGAISYPDLTPTLIAGLTVNRFTEFNGSGVRFNAIQQTAGFNFATVSWTERIKWFDGWNGNLTIGGGPTGDEPSIYLQNGFVHRLLGNKPVPVNETRGGADFMLGGSVTRWWGLFGSSENGFAGMGLAVGSLYQEVYGRVGLRRVSIAEILASINPAIVPQALETFSRYVRFSGMGRYGRLYGGSAYSDDVIANQSYLGQVSVSIADYDGHDPPRWELEFAATIDSGLFVTPSGHGIERRFGSLAIHFPYGVVETWNDVLGKTDSGPTYGFRLMIDILRIQAALASP